MGVKLSDLPPDVQKRIVEGSAGRLAATEKRMKARKSRAGTGDAAPCPGSCGCGETFPHYRAWETKHSGPGHSRWSIDL